MFNLPCIRNRAPHHTRVVGGASEAQSRRHDAKGSVRDRTRLANQKGSVATGWLRALPNKAMRTEMPDGEFRLLLRWWLGLQILPTGETYLIKMS